MQAGTALIGRRLLAAFVAVMLMASVMLLFAESAAGQEGNPPSVECASDLWNNEYWKIQVNDGSLGQIETSEPGAISLSTDGSWTNNTDWEVFRIIMKVGQGTGSDVIHEPPVNPIDLTLNGLSHVTFCFTETTTTTEPEDTTTTTQAEETTTTVEDTTTTTIEDEVLPTVITTSTTAAPTTTVEDEVLDTEVLPFTGGENDMLALLAGGLGLLGALVLASTRRMEEN